MPKRRSKRQIRRYADPGKEDGTVYRCIGAGREGGRVCRCISPVYRRCEGKSTPTRPSTRQIRRYADTPIRAGNTPIRRYAGRRYADPGREGISVYRCIGAELFTRRGLRALCKVEPSEFQGFGPRVQCHLVLSFHPSATEPQPLAPRSLCIKKHLKVRACEHRLSFVKLAKSSISDPRKGCEASGQDCDWVSDVLLRVLRSY